MLQHWNSMLYFIHTTTYKNIRTCVQLKLIIIITQQMNTYKKKTNMKST